MKHHNPPKYPTHNPEQRKRRAKELLRRRNLKEYFFIKYGDVCMTCGKPPDYRGLTLSHIVPLSQGGQTTEENCRNECMKCHSPKHGIKEVT